MKRSLDSYEDSQQSGGYNRPILPKDVGRKWKAFVALDAWGFQWNKPWPTSWPEGAWILREWRIGPFVYWKFADQDQIKKNVRLVRQRGRIRDDD